MSGRLGWVVLGLMACVACEREPEPAPASPEPAGPPIPVPTAEDVAAAKAAGLAELRTMNAVGPYVIEGNDFVYIRKEGEAVRLDLDEPRIEYGDVKEGRVHFVMTLHALYEVAGDGSTMLVEDPLTASERLARGPQYDPTLEVFHAIARPARLALPKDTKPPPTVKVDPSWLEPYADYPSRMRVMPCKRHEVAGTFVGCF